MSRNCTRLKSRTRAAFSCSRPHIINVYIRKNDFTLLLLHSDSIWRGLHALSSYIIIFSKGHFSFSTIRLSTFRTAIHGSFTLAGVFKLTDILVLLSIITSPTLLFTHSAIYHHRIYVFVCLSLLHKLIIYREN